MKDLPVLTTACLPPAGYIKTILLYGGAIIDEHEHFVKQTIRNHYTILTANGVLRLSIPVIHHASKMVIKDVCISYAEPWQRIHLNAIKSAYGKAPYFKFFIEELENIILQTPACLADLNKLLLSWAFRCMKVEPEIRFTGYYSNHQNDLRSASAKHSGFFDQQAEGIRYTQVFSDRMPFIANLSIADVIFNCGHLSASVLTGN
jgi:hypothetical protein